MERPTNNVPKLSESEEEIVIIPYHFNENSLETIGADNFRGLNEEKQIIDLGADNFRAKPVKIEKSNK